MSEKSEIDRLNRELDMALREAHAASVNAAKWLAESQKYQLIAEQAQAHRARILQVVAEQANDNGLWFRARTAPEAYLQSSLRFLHEAIKEKKA